MAGTLATPLFGQAAAKAGGLAAMTIGDAILVGGSVLGAGSILSASAASRQRSNMQAELYRRQAERDREVGALKARRLRRDNARVAATQRALMAGGGTALGSGSALLAERDLAEEGALNARILEDNTATRVEDTLARGVMERAAGRNSAQASYLRAGSTLLDDLRRWDELDLFG